MSSHFVIGNGVQHKRITKQDRLRDSTVTNSFYPQAALQGTSHYTFFSSADVIFMLVRTPRTPRGPGISDNTLSDSLRRIAIVHAVLRTHCRVSSRRSSVPSCAHIRSMDTLFFTTEHLTSLHSFTGTHWNDSIAGTRCRLSKSTWFPRVRVPSTTA